VVRLIDMHQRKKARNKVLGNGRSTAEEERDVGGGRKRSANIILGKSLKLTRKKSFGSKGVLCPVGGGKRANVRLEGGRLGGKAKGQKTPMS